MFTLSILELIALAVAFISIGWAAAVLTAYIIEDVSEKKNECFKVVTESSFISYDEMGYPLRLCVVKTSKKPGTPFKQMWLDSDERPGDIKVPAEVARHQNIIG